MDTATLPQPVRPHLEGYASSGEDFRTGSAAGVFHWTHATKENLFLKIQDRRADPQAPGLRPERAAMDWLRGKLSVPRVVCYHLAGEIEYLLTTQIPGGPGHRVRAKQDIPALVRAFARGLREIHALPYDGCPLDQRLGARFARAQAQLDRVADAPVGDTPRAALAQKEGDTLDTLAQELADLRARAPAAEDLVFVHGDYCLPNVLVEGGRLTGFIDWGYAGVGDRYLDFAAAYFTIGRNIGPEWRTPFFAEYGLDQLDAEKLAYYRRIYALE